MNNVLAYCVIFYWFFFSTKSVFMQSKDKKPTIAGSAGLAGRPDAGLREARAYVCGMGRWGVWRTDWEKSVHERCMCECKSQSERSECVERRFWLFSRRMKLVPALCVWIPLLHCPWCWIGWNVFSLSLSSSLPSSFLSSLRLCLILFLSVHSILPSQLHKLCYYETVCCHSDTQYTSHNHPHPHPHPNAKVDFIKDNDICK